MSVEAVAAAHYAAQRAITAAVGRSVAAEWAKVDPKYLDASFAAVAPRLTATVIAGQLAAASQADTYVRRVLAEQNVDAPPEGRVNPRGFAGTAADGRPLDTLMASPLIAAKMESGAGGSLSQVSNAGLTALMQIIGTEIPDAGRTADGVALAIRPQVTGYVRMVSPPSCSRCAILAGRWYRWSAGFQRHPRCDCRHIPASEDVAGDIRTDPQALFNKGQVTGLSKADSAAIAHGADMSQVVNAQRGMYTAGGRKLTTTNARGWGGIRPRPEQIYRDAASRAEANEMLERFGYTTKASATRSVAVVEKVIPPRVNMTGPTPALPSSWEVNLKGIDKAVASEVEDVLARLAVAYPEVASQVSFLGTSTAARRKWRVGGLNGRGSTYGWTLKAPPGGTAPIALVQSNIGKYAAFTTELANEVAKGWLTAGSGSVRGIVTHEFGHQVFHSIVKSKARTEAWESAVAARLGVTGRERAWHRALSDGGATVSKYAGSNADERFAESFASVIHDPNASEFARILVEEAERVLKEIPA